MTRDRTLGKRPAAATSRLGAFLIGALAAISAMPVASEVQIQQRPLTLGSDVPNNIVLVPSVEHPTLNSVANFFGTTDAQKNTYDSKFESVGYFDSNKCYKYVYADEEPKRHFEPVGVAGANYSCSGGDKQWSGNFLNWVGTQTIDPFRKALTGGYRVLDTPTETWLEKANFHSSFKPVIATDYFRLLPVPDKGIPATDDKKAWFQVAGNGNQVVFGFDLADFFSKPLAYNPAVHALNGTGVNGTKPDRRLYTVSLRVQVCVDRGVVKPEPNCKKYANAYKPEGLIQQYNDRMRYSAFAYLNDSSIGRDGGVMRARQKYVGPFSYDPVEGVKSNPAREWDPDTGVQYADPDSTDSAATNSSAGTKVVVNSGVINYINKFGQTTAYAPKSLDPFSELFYIALRYLKKQGNVPTYSALNAANADQWTDRFPVITQWDDPIQYTCQRNVAIGIGDANTWDDRNLPGSTYRPAVNPLTNVGEPARPSEVSADNTVNVETDYQNLARLELAEGIALPAANATFSGRGNSAFVAALAYAAHTRDLRGDLEGMQTLSSFFVDVAESGIVQGRSSNQYYLAAKYGGFDVPPGFNPDQRNTVLQEAWWVGTDGSGKPELVGVGGLANDKRPRNYFLANQAGVMINSLDRVFKAAAEQPRRGAAAVVGTNGASVQDGAMVYVPTYYTDWSGELSAYVVDPITKTLMPRWSASAKVPAPAARKIYASSNGYGAFVWSGLDAKHRRNIGNEDVLNYLRGDRSKEAANGGGLRDRGNVLGDFVNSSPLHVGAPSPALYADAGFTGAGKAYVAFAQAQAARAGTVYIGGNDGMLHGFDAGTGAETYAFIPAAVLNIPNGLADYAKPEYREAHRYFVDGELTAADVFINGQWRTVLVGTMGRGGKSVFALDVTDPSAVSLLWEKNGDQVPALGNNLSKPTIVQTSDGVWKALLGNGPNSESGAAYLLAFDLATGSVETVATDASVDNGLSGVRAWDADRDGFFESAYAGDLHGAMWRFSGLGGGATDSQRVFQAQAGQAITVVPLVGFRPDSVETWVFFGTGRFLGGTDVTDSAVQSWYGIIDSGKTASRGNLVQRTIEYEGVVKNGQGKDVTVRVISAAADGDMAKKDGWYIDLVSPGASATGERMVVPNLFDGSRLLGITRTPNGKNPCSPGGSGFTMEIDPFTGARLDRDVFDTNGDGKIDAGDSVAGGSGGQPGKVPASGIGSNEAENGAVIVPGMPENIIVKTDDGGDVGAARTPVAGIGVKRVSWREVVRDIQ
ncbi:hypothetical protein J5226_11780 [Lysobacter sp. K5869]|uniref:pilus assembly protein n=1 Tax=Lysobacter sp. K5869 TaxID=2820808 RepID=UPI001C061B4C|nr:PilC/PilY family type IV pilus protein [Lysobacter sp. K5869]QWP79017.1 hypothetical protein J5226_11780 [Lysobacter sp. K5869]